jgi:hypothetical protein
MIGWAGLSACAGEAGGDDRAELRAGTAARRGAAANFSHGAMADTLAALYARAVQAPQRNPFLNRVRADSIEAQLVNTGGMRSDFDGRYLLAQERILAGQSRTGIEILEGMAVDLGITIQAVNAQNKPLFDLLAIANLRLGEQENCVGDVARNVCILPLKGAAVHKKQDGARKAIALYEGMLRAFPNDRGSVWLLNMAYMAIGGYPDSIPAKWRVPGLAPRADDPFPLFPNIAGDVGLARTGLSGGVAVEDFDGDGTLDLIMTSFGMNDPVRLFLADGKGGYIDRTAGTGLAGITGGLNVVHADYDNDGRPDVFVMRGAWLAEAGAIPNSLLHNTGLGTFEDVTIRAGLFAMHPTPTAAWGDFNLDGRLDLFVGNESSVAQDGTSHPSELWLNNGNGSFSNVAREIGVDVDAFVKGVAWGDINNDGLPDLYVSVLNGPNRLFVNRGGTSIATWRFEERAAAAGVQRPIASFGTWFWDYDQDGWLDLMVLSYDIRNGQALHDAVATEYLERAGRVRPTGALDAAHVESSRLYRNNRDGTFTDVTREVGLADKVIFAMGHNFGDLDNDGWLDFYVGTGNPDLRSIIPNRMFRNVSGRRFEEVTLPGGFGHIQKGHAAAFVDLDRDGDEDVYMVMGGAYEGDVFANVLFENPGWHRNAWLTLELEGRAANRSAIGARVAIRTSEANGARRTLHRTVGTGGSFGSGSLQLHVGLGNATRIDEVRITWPDSARSVSTHAALSLGMTYRIVQGSQAVPLVRPPIAFAKKAMAGMRHDSSN